MSRRLNLNILCRLYDYVDEIPAESNQPESRMPNFFPLHLSRTWSNQFYWLTRQHGAESLLI